MYVVLKNGGGFLQILNPNPAWPVCFGEIAISTKFDALEDAAAAALVWGGSVVRYHSHRETWSPLEPDVGA